MLQANEGPSWISHQYVIAGQSGGYSYPPPNGIAPDAEAENPASGKNNSLDSWPDPTSDYSEATSYPDGEYADTPTVGCGSTPNAHKEHLLDMQEAYAQARNDEHNQIPMPISKACTDYLTIFDLLNQQYGAELPATNIQYIFHNTNSIWAAPLGVQHLYNSWVNDGNHGPSDATGIEIDPDAEYFVNHTLQGTGLPFAKLTYITPCFNSSDHPNSHGPGNGFRGWSTPSGGASTGRARRS
jgi:hypothetical protein